MVVKFQCIRSGNFISFSNESDIEETRRNEAYREIENEIKETIKETSTNEDANTNETRQVLKQRGRPKKQNYI